MHENSENNAAAIEDVLEAEREALLCGDLERVGRLKSRKEDLLADLLESRVGLSAENYARLSEKAARNQALLAGAAQGIAAVRQRLQEIRNAQSGDGSYTADGRRSEPFRPASFEKRA